MKKVVIYPGRFQPMLNHHLAVYDHLKSAFPDAEVYIGTSDKTEEGSPFNFKEKQLIAQTQGIDSDKVLFARQPYLHTFYDQFDHEETQVIFAVGEKDIGTRFPLNNIDPETGLDMTVNPDKETGKHRPKYYQMINTIKDEPLPMKVRGYLYPVKNIEVEGEVASATAFRNAIKNSPDKESAKEVFSKQFKDYNEQVFNLVYNKLAGEKMSEDLNIMKQLAGLEVTEGAPIEFEDQVSVKDITFAEVSKSSSKLSIANRFPEGADVNDMDAKKEMYVKELLKSPVALLSEINERIMPDENGLAVSSKLNKILDGMREGGITDLEAEDKGFVMDLVKHSLKNMELEAGDNREFDPESGALESLDLDEIRSNYSIAEKYKYANTEELLKDVIAGYQYKIDDNHPDEINVQDHEDAIDWYEGLLDQHRKTGEDTFHAPFGGDTAWREMIWQEMEDLGIYKPHGQGDMRGIDNLPEDETMGEGKVKDMAMDQADEFYGKVSDVADKTNDIEKAIIDAWKDEEENPPVWALDDGARDILANAGLIDEEPEEPEMEESIEEDACPKCGEKRHKLKACASCGCSESFDPDMEPSRKEEAMNLVADQKWEEAAGVLGDTSKNAGSLLMAEWEEFCSLRGLDKKDTMEDFDAIENFIDELIGTMDDKQYPAEMESIEEQENAIVGKALDSAMEDLKKLAGLY